MLTQVMEILKSTTSAAATIPPTILYNEGWLLRLVLALAGRGLNGLPFPFMPGARWFSEGLLDSPFRPRTRGDSLAEGRTHADGIVGHFKLTDRTKAGVELTADATQFVVCEAKMFSRLSQGTKRAAGYNQAARSVACMALALSKANRPLATYCSLGFFILAPGNQIADGVFSGEMTKDSLRAAITDRVNLYDERERSKTLEPWLHSWVLPLLNTESAFTVECVSWESVIEGIAAQDAQIGGRLRVFYAECLHHNGSAAIA